MNDLKTAAYSQIPGWTQVQGGLDALDQALRKPALAPATADPVDDAVAAALAGDPIPPDLGERQQARTLAAQAAISHRRVLEAARDRLRVERAELEADQAGPAFEHLRTELADVVQTVRAAASTLGTTLTADQVALTGDRTVLAAWKTLDTQLGRWRAVRAVQGSLYRAAGDESLSVPAHPLNDLQTHVGLIADSFDVDAFWLRLRRQAASAALRAANQPIRQWADWLQTAGPGLPMGWPTPGIDDHAWLVKVCVDANPWLPDTGTLLACWQAAEAVTGTTATPTTLIG